LEHRLQHTAGMTDALHIKAFRLFELSQASRQEGGFQLTEWEGEHLQHCEECRELSAVFSRQISERPAALPRNGEINPKDGLYKNICCGFEVYIPAGNVFPDCQRHANLPTAWKRIDGDPIPRAADLNQKRSA